MPAMVFDHIVDEPKKSLVILGKVATLAIIKNHEIFLHVN